jgi:hypothetical protein
VNAGIDATSIKEAADNETWYLFLDPSYGYKGDYNAINDYSNKFGNYSNVTKRINGAKYYEAYSLGQRAEDLW